jgi:hypothetical protein
MGYSHDLLVVPNADLASVVEDAAHASQSSCVPDVGLEAETIANIISALRGVDVDESLEDLLDEIEANHYESNDGDGAFGTAMSDSIRDELAGVQDEQIAGVLAKWLALEGKHARFGSIHPEHSLRQLVGQCRLAKNLRAAVVIKSHE